MSYTNIMVDLETLDNSNTAAIISIGAVAFDAAGISTDAFYTNVNPKSCTDAGLTIGADTVMWWMRQSDAARKSLSADKTPLAEALAMFTGWVQRVSGFSSDVCIWGNGATFDNVILTNAYRAVDQHRPWSYKGDRCYRTLRAMYPNVTSIDMGVAHNALDDARAQALHASKLLHAAGVWAK